MKRSLFWATVACIVAIIVLFPLNVNVFADATTDAAKTRMVNFFSLFIIELLLIFTLVFNIANVYAQTHTNNDSLFHKLAKDTDIPDSYFMKDKGKGNGKPE